MGLEGKRAVITGAGSGIGRATAQLFAGEGCNVVLGDLNESGLKETVQSIDKSGQVTDMVTTDVSDPSSVERLVAAAVETMGGLDVVVNVAGIQRSASIIEMELESWDAHFAVNVRSCFLMAKASVPHLAEAGGGAFVSVASIAALKGIAGLTAYSASKGAVVALTRALAVEVAEQNIRVTCLCPGWVDTPFNDPVVSFMGGRESHQEMVAASVPLGRQGQPPEMAEAIRYLASDASSYMTGQALVVDGGITG